MPARLLQPATLAEADAAVGKGQAAYLAGGTALQLAWPAPNTPHVQSPDVALIDIRPWCGAPGIAATPSGLAIAAGTKLETLRTDARVCSQAPLLAAACATLGSLAVRHLGTLGGNVAWRFGDTVAALLALDAQVEFAHGARMALADAIAQATLPLIRALHVPTASPAASAAQFYEKVGHRAAFSPSRLALAARASLDGGGRIVRIHLGASGAGLPGRRLRHAQDWLTGRAARGTAPGDPGLRHALAQDLPGDSVRVRLAARLLAGHLGTFRPEVQA